ncbi:MAG TPA: delta-60 repeat domain-containing protein [Nitrospira sp.]|nr:delta-60 repeat domain-containing protein [Nitrospira sp.]
MAQDGTQDLYVGGDFTNYNGTPTNRLIRLHPNGTVAQAFSQGFDQPVIALAPATDGSNALYAGGWFTQFNGQAVPQLVRLTASGLRDSTFQVDQFFGQDAFQSAFVIDLAVTEDGSNDVYVAGNVVEGVPETPVDRIVGRVVRLNPDGSPDPAFGDVRYVGPPDLNTEIVWAIAVPPASGKVYVGGLLGTNGLIRLNPDGTVDSTFTGLPGNAGTIELAADGSRDIYAGGLRAFGPIRVHETGALDTTFSPTEPINTLATFAIASAEDGTGDVVVSGPFRLLRINRNGELAPTFQEPTLSPALPGPNGDHSVYTMVPIPDGTRDFYIGGAFSAYNGGPANNFARIHADGSLASTGTALP